MKWFQAKNIKIIVPHAALMTIFDECDRFDRDETGGRIVGVFKEERGILTLTISGLIEAGPKAERSPTYYLGDVDYQEDTFRKIESVHPEVEHLGNWHTHHVNGLSRLSGGDLATYQRTVNHPNQNTPFFYALLVVARQKSKDPLQRYSLKHYVFRPNDDRVHEVSANMVEITEGPLIWPSDPDPVSSSESPEDIPSADPQARSNPEHSPVELGEKSVIAKPERVYDRDIIGEFYRGVRPYTAPQLGLYWRGPIELANGQKTEVIVLEDASSTEPTYSVTLRLPTESLIAVGEQLAKRDFPSARSALITAERSCNRILFELGGGSKLPDEAN